MQLRASGGADDDTRRYRAVFLPLWAAMVALQSGFLIHDVSAAWLITEQARASSVVALVQTAAAAPFFVLALPAGALADLYERSRIIQRVGFVLAAVALLLSAATALGQASVAVLLAVSLLNGCGNALFTPAWQAMTPELIRGARLPGALALNSLGINIARSLGPLAAGLLLFALGPATAFLFNAIVFAAVAVCFATIGRSVVPATAQGEGFVDALRTGVAYLRQDRGLQSVAAKAVAFFFFASSFWALAPVVVVARFGGTSVMLGVMVGCVGLGAIAGALMLRWLRRRFDIDGLMMGAGLLASAALLLIPFAPHPVAFGLLQVVLGCCWLLCFSSVHLAAQLRLSPWVRGRGTSMYLVAIFGSVAVGSVLAGLVADLAGTGVAYAAAAAGLFVATLAATRLKITIQSPGWSSPALPQP